MARRLRITLQFALGALLALPTGVASPAHAGARNTSSEEATCRDIGFRPRTPAYGDCVMKLVARNATPAIPLSPDEQTCANNGFRRETLQFNQCLMQQEDQRRYAQLQQQQQYQYQQQLALQQQQLQQQQQQFQQQQQALAETERRRENQREADALLRMGQFLLRQPTPQGNPIVTCNTFGATTNCSGW